MLHRMIAIVGAGGKVGFTTIQTLRHADVPVRAIVRGSTKETSLKEMGCETATADLLDVAALTKAFTGVEAVQIILPVNIQSKDGAQELRDTVESIVVALQQAKPKRVLLISDYGAHVKRDIGLPTVFRTLEDRIRELSGQNIFLRSAPHMQNWARGIPAAIKSGVLATFQDPLDAGQPTISAHDVGSIAAELLLRPLGSEEVQVVHAEGPRRCTANDVAAALSELTNKSIYAAALPRSEWGEMVKTGVSLSLADLFINTNDAQNEGGLIEVDKGVGEVWYGTTELIDALRLLVPSA